MPVSSTPTADGPTTLRPDAVGFLDTLVIGLASTSPAYSLAAVLGPVVALVGVHAPGVLLASFVPMLLIAGAFAALAVLTRDSALSVLAMLVAGMIAVAAGLFMFVQGWIWSQRAYRRGATGRSVLIAIGGGLMIVLAAFALAAVVILVMVFYLG